MLNAQENELLTKVGPGTPMGNLFRQYWLPALTSEELPFPDCPPVRIRILNEDLVAFRTTSGRVGLIQQGCPHRSAEFFFGRNEEDGIRCTYHGWKFDITGACVDMPSEPPESTFKERVQATAYPCVERGGAIWTYMGPRKTPPALPDIECNMRVDAAPVQADLLDCNWFQAVENNMDTAHLAFLHYGSIPVEAGESEDWWKEVGAAYPEDFKYILRDRHPRIVARDTESGTSYAGIRNAEPDTYYLRTMHFLFPCVTMGPNGPLGKRVQCIYTVPVDDTHSMEFRMNVQRSGSTATMSTANTFVDEILPNVSHPLGRFRYRLNMDNDFGIDRDLQRGDHRTHRGFTGMGGIGIQDRAITLSQGATVDRTVERLAETDAMIIRTRQRLLNATKALEDGGIVPPGVDNPEVYRMRSGWVFVPRNVDYWETTKPLRERFEADKVAAAPVIS